MRTSNKLRTRGLVILVLLACEYILGMLTNLYVAFPEGKTDYQQWEFAYTQLLPLFHIIIGLLLLAGSIELLVKAMKIKVHIWKIASSIGLVSILLAVATGSEFISTQQDGYSFAMSALFIIAVAAYGWGIYTTKE